MGDWLSIDWQPGPSGIAAATESQELLPEGSTAGLGAGGKGSVQKATLLWSLHICKRRARQGVGEG